jgi:hypothetical protein
LIDTTIIELKRMRWEEHIPRLGKKSIENFCGKLEGKKLLTRSKCKWEDIKINLKEV